MLLTVYNLQCIIRFSLTLMLPSVKTKTMASSRFGNEDPDAFTDDNLWSKRTGDSTTFALSVLKEFMNARDVDILSLAVEELNIILKDFLHQRQI